MTHPNLLVELFVEELPPKALQKLGDAFAGVLLAQLQTQGKLAVIHEPNEMVAALMRVMGIDQVAQIEPRKF